MSTSPAAGERDDWAVTFAFWGTLLVAGAMFAAVSLAPKLQTLADQHKDFVANRQRLAVLERRAAELDRVAAALEHDPAFAAELAKVEFDAGRPGDQRITVDRELRLGGSDRREEARASDARPPAARWPILTSLLDPLATHTALRTSLLTVAATLVLVAFLVLHEEQAATVRLVAEGVRKLADSLLERYRGV